MSSDTDTLVRPVLEHGSTVWDPLLQIDIKALETIQRRIYIYILIVMNLDLLGVRCVSLTALNSCKNHQ